jgi:hypothetical protein
MGQPVNAIRRNETPRMGTVVMEHFSHQQNLAHCRRQLAEAELATSSDEIRHSMLMRLLAEEEAHGLLPMTVTGRQMPRATPTELAFTRDQRTRDGLVRNRCERDPAAISHL